MFNAFITIVSFFWKRKWDKMKEAIVGNLVKMTYCSHSQN